MGRLTNYEYEYNAILSLSKWKTQQHLFSFGENEEFCFYYDLEKLQIFIANTSLTKSFSANFYGTYYNKNTMYVDKEENDVFKPFSFTNDRPGINTEIAPNEGLYFSDCNGAYSNKFAPDTHNSFHNVSQLNILIPSSPKTIYVFEHIRNFNLNSKQCFVSIKRY